MRHTPSSLSRPKMKHLIPLLVLFLQSVVGDVYMQNPRGSNNRLSESTSNRKNANRLFDSQNNNKGGYNTGDRLSSEFGSRPQRQYSMQYYGSGPTPGEGSKLMVEWTNQHGCGEPGEKNKCNIVIQYMCMRNGTDDDYPTSSTRSEDSIESRAFYMRDGVSTNTQDYRKPRRNEKDRDFVRRMGDNFKNTKDSRGLHESVWWYDYCRYREANGGLFTADQDLDRDEVGYVTSSRTRQNPDGTRRGFECPEERDYFPYWVPTNQHEELSRFQNTPWIDLVWLGDKSKCNYIKSNSYNQNNKFRCVLSRDEDERSYGRYITKDDCEDHDGDWVEFTSFTEVLENVSSESACNAMRSTDKRNKIFWGKLRSDSNKKSCIVQAPELTCDEAPWTRVNHLGNAYNDMGDKTTPNASRVEIDIPYFPSGEAKRCVMRLRYNISTTDYDPWTTDSKSNDNDDVIENNPEVDVLGNGEELQLAINTAQTGRTFEDRSHVFVVLPRLSTMEGKTLYNLNVRGKRGNIVQTFPATEYDFIPDRLTVKKSDLVHIQWTGSNSHDNNNDGDAGQGKGGTDRHNLLQMDSLGESYPLTIKNAKFWDNVKSLTDPEASGEDIAVGFATSGFYCGKKETDVCEEKYSMKRKRRLDDELDNAPASYFGHVLEFKGTGSMHFMCSRNNNFSNRSQKGALWVKN